MSARIFMLTIVLLNPVGACGLAAQQADQDASAPRYQKGVLIEVNGVILPMLETYLDRKLDRAQELGAELVILEIDSPGGAIETTFNIVARLRGVDWAHTVAFVPDEALSGGAIAALACDEIIMGSSARLGDAGPVVAGPDALFRHAPEKIQSDLARRVRDLASATERPPALAEAMVDMDVVVYRVRNKESGDVTYMSQAELDSMENPEVWEKGRPVIESREGSFLEVNGKRAVELQLAAATVDNRAELAEHIAVAEPLIILRRTALDITVDILNRPLVTGLLFVVGAIALYVELSAPGVGVGGLISGLCFALFFWSRFLGGTAGWLEIILVLAGIAFLAAELFIIPGFGIAGIAGLLLMVGGLVLASQNHFIPQTPRGMHHMATSLLVLLSAAAVSLLAFAVLSRFYGSVPVLNRLVLRAPSPADETADSAVATSLPLTQKISPNVGDVGTADSPLRPAGRAVFGDAYLDVVTDGSFVERKTRVRIIEISGNRIVVRQVDP